MYCGPTSLKIIAHFHGRRFSTKYLRDLCNISKEGVSLLDISRASELIGFRSLALRVSYDDLVKKIPLPCIIHWDYSHFVVLYKASKNKAYISDPRLGLVSYNRSEFCAYWKKNNERGYALVLEPNADFTNSDNESSREVKAFDYFSYLRQYKGFLFQVFLGMLIGVFLNLLFPFITQSIVDIGIETKDYDFIHILLFASVILTMSSAFSSFVQSRIMLFVSDRVNISMVSTFISKIINLPISFFERKMTSDILARIGDHSRIQSFIFETLLSVSIAAFSFIVYSVILVYYHISLFLVFLSGTILYIGWIFLFLKRRKRLDMKYFEESVINQNEIIQLIDGIEEIKVNNLQQRKKWDWIESRMKIFDLNLKMLNLSEVQNVGTIVIDKIKNVLITFFAADAVIKGEMTLGMMLSVQYIIGQMNGPVAMLIGYIHSYQDAKISMERVNEVINEEKEEVRSTSMPMPVPSNVGIRIEKLSFAYHQNAANVLDDISLHIPEGKMTAIVGASGSGKSTLMKILLRFYDDYDGKIIIGESTDLRSIDIENWRANCGSILQNGKIFNDSILKNIVLDDERIDLDRLHNAIDSANLTEFIEALPLKLYTMLGPGGSGISGGQMQRLLIARALYKNPKILFMDEATNALDAKNEMQITQHLLEKFAGRTTVVIAHRLSTIQTADQIIVLDKGRIVEKGMHNELILQSAYYHELVSSQLQISQL
jgi:ATP-binding cassette subfamily B protein